MGAGVGLRIVVDTMTNLEQSFMKAVAKANDQRGKPAYLGKSDGTLYWVAPDGMTHRTRVWARIGERNSNQAVVVDCLKASPQVDLPVRVDYVNGVLTVVDTDHKRATEFDGGRGGTNVPAHAWLHSRLGPDPVYIEGLQYLPLLVTPTNPADLTVTVQAGAYYDLTGDLQVFDTAVSGSTSAYVPGSGYHFVIICLDRSDGSIVIVDGDDVSGGGDALFPSVSVTAADIEAVTIDPDYWPLAVVLLSAGQTQIRPRDIVRDLRPVVGGAGGGGTPGGSDTYVQFNDGGMFGGDDGLTFNKTTNALAVGGLLQVGPSAALLDVYADGFLVNKVASDMDSIFSGSGSSATQLFVVDAGDAAVYIGTDTAGTIAQFTPVAIVLNNAEADVDIRWGGLGVTNGYFYDAGNNRHGFGTGTPQRVFHIIGPDGEVASFPSSLGAADLLVFENAGNANMALIGNSTGTSLGLKMYKSGSTTHDGAILYNNNNDSMIFQTAAATRFSIDSGGIISCLATTGAFKVNSLTTTQRNALTAADSMIIYNTTTGKFQGRASGAWVDLH